MIDMLRRSLSLCALTAIVMLVFAAGITTAQERRGPSFPRIANVYGTTLTADGARVSGETHSLSDVARCDLLIGVRGAGQGKAADELFKRQLTALQQLNPYLKGLRFACSAPYTHMKPTDELMARREAGKPFPWLLQTDGKPIAGWPGTYMLNLTCPGVIEWLAQTTVPPVRDQGYDGVFIDCMGPHFDSWACEIATGRPYTVDHDGDGQDDDRRQLAELWSQAKIALAHRTRELLGDEPIFMANQADESLRDQLNGIYLEDYIDAVLDGRMEWEYVLDLYLKWTETKHQPNVTVLGCASGVEPPFEGYKLPAEEQAKFFAQGRPKLNRMRFGLATTLMGDGYYSYDLHTRWRGQLWWYPEYDAPLGYPIETCHRVGDGTWHRRFDGGLVVVNPTNWDIFVSLDGACRDVSSGRVGRQFTIPRHDGRIFVPPDTEVATGTLADPAETLSWDGPQGIVQRDNLTVVRDGNGLAVLLNESGGVDSFCVDGDELIAGVQSVIVQDDRWKNFATSNCQHTVQANGAVVFTGMRTFAEQKLSFTTSVRVERRTMTIDFEWTALTPLQIRAFRQAIDLSPRRFGGTTFKWGDGKITLPQDVPEEPNLASGIRAASLSIDNERRLSIKLPQESQLLDNRCYRGSDYLLNFYPVAGEVPAGKQWSYSLVFAVE